MSYYGGDSVYSDITSNTEKTENYYEENYESDDASSDCVSESQLEEIEMYTSNRNHELKSRLGQLQNQMFSLQIKLETEKQLCKKELDEVTLLKNMQNNGSITFQSDLDYADAIIKAQTAKKNALQRQLAINNYKKRLLEVENMCNLELLKVKQSVKFLQPLQVIANEWQKETGKGDASKDTGTESGPRPVFQEQKKKALNIESVGNLICSEMNSIFNKLTDEIKLASNVWQDDNNFDYCLSESIADDDLSITSANAMAESNPSEVTHDNS